MKSNLPLLAFLFGVILFVAGMILLFCATTIGMELAKWAIQANGGSMDTNKYMLIMKSQILSYQIGGAICSLIGGAGILLFGSRLSR